MQVGGFIVLWEDHFKQYPQAIVSTRAHQGGMRQICRVPHQWAPMDGMRTCGGLKVVFPHHNEASNMHDPVTQNFLTLPSPF